MINQNITNVDAYFMNSIEMTATDSTPSKPIIYRYSGHETFVCRYAWLPKVIQKIADAPDLFEDEDRAMVELGVGKNMVRSIRFWGEAAQIIQPAKAGHSPTLFGQQLLGHDGYDEFLERPETLWLLHWKLSTNTAQPLFHWHQMLNFWHRSEFTLSEAISFLERGLPVSAAKRSARTLSDGLRVFVNSYVPSRGRKGEIAEDNLDCPLTELGLISAVGERTSSNQSRREAIYSFSIGDKPTVTPSLFAFCVHDYWNSHHPDEETLAFRFVSTAAGSPGQIFKLPELSVRKHLESLANATGTAMEFLESSSIQQIVRHRKLDDSKLLDSIYLDD